MTSGISIYLPSITLTNFVFVSQLMISLIISITLVFLLYPISSRCSFYSLLSLRHNGCIVFIRQLSSLMKMLKMKTGDFSENNFQPMITHANRITIELHQLRFLTILLGLHDYTKLTIFISFGEDKRQIEQLFLLFYPQIRNL